MKVVAIGVACLCLGAASFVCGRWMSARIPSCQSAILAHPRRVQVSVYDDAERNSGSNLLGKNLHLQAVTIQGDGQSACVETVHNQGTGRDEEETMHTVTLWIAGDERVDHATNDPDWLLP